MPAGLEHQLIDFLQHNISWGLIVVVMALESANIPIPSEITMPIAGWLLISNNGGSPIQGFLMGGLFGALGCLIGSVINYGVGYYGGRPFVERFGKYILIGKKDIERADKWFARWGDWASFLSRLLPVVRTFISFPAGMLKVNFPRFSVFTFIGSFIWCAILTLIGTVLGDQYEQIRSVMRPFDYPIILILVLLLAYYVYRHVRHARNDPADEPATPA